jgi:hypothetical protein
MALTGQPVSAYTRRRSGSRFGHTRIRGAFGKFLTITSSTATPYDLLCSQIRCLFPFHRDIGY